MRGIIKSEHIKLCALLEQIHSSAYIQGQMQSSIEHEWNNLFKIYEAKMVELKILINQYYEKEKLIKNEIRKLKKSNNELDFEKKKLVSLT